MEKLKSIFEFIFSSYKKTAAVLVVLAMALSIPITLSLLGQQQDMRQRAAVPAPGLVCDPGTLMGGRYCADLVTCYDLRCNSAGTGTVRVNYTGLACARCIPPPTPTPVPPTPTPTPVLRARTAPTPTPVPRGPAVSPCSITQYCNGYNTGITISWTRQETGYNHQVWWTGSGGSVSVGDFSSYSIDPVTVGASITGNVRAFLGESIGPTCTTNTITTTACPEQTATPAPQGTCPGTCAPASDLGRACGVGGTWSPMGGTCPANNTCMHCEGSGATPVQSCTPSDIVSGPHCTGPAACYYVYCNFDGTGTVNVNLTGAACAACALTPAPRALTPTPTPRAPAAGSTVLAMTAAMPGIGGTGGNITPRRPSRTAEIKVFNSQNQVVKTVSGALAFNGTAFAGTIDLGTGFASGTYTLKIKLDNTLVRLVPLMQNITSGTTNQIPQVSLVSGDIDGNNILDILDWNAILSCVKGETACAQDKKTLADLNDDGKVDEMDLNIILRGFAIRRGD